MTATANIPLAPSDIHHGPSISLNHLSFPEGNVLNKETKNVSRRTLFDIDGNDVASRVHDTGGHVHLLLVL